MPDDDLYKLTSAPNVNLFDAELFGIASDVFDCKLLAIKLSGVYSVLVVDLYNSTSAPNVRGYVRTIANQY